MLYALSFLTFGLSDFREAYAVQTWLIVFKAANLGLLLYLRVLVIRRHYPGSRLFRGCGGGKLSIGSLDLYQP